MTDVVNHPPHYIGSNGIEAFDVIEGFGLTYNLGTAVGYLLRADRKGRPVEDIRKAVAHLCREIEQRERTTPPSEIVVAETARQSSLAKDERNYIQRRARRK